MDVQSINCYFEIQEILVSIVVSIPACHAGDRGSIPRRGDYFLDKNLRFLVHGHSQNLRKK